MRELVATVTKRGQTTIPAEVRKRLNLTDGDKIAFVLEADGSIRLRRPKYATIQSLQGAAHSYAANVDPSLTLAQMREAAYEERLERKLGHQRK